MRERSDEAGRIHHLGSAGGFEDMADEIGDARIIHLTTGNGADRKAFFDTVRSAVALDPPVESERSWDALEDSFWQALYMLAEPRLVVTWLDQSTYQANCPTEHQIAMSVLVDVAEGLADERATVGRTKDVQIYIA